MAKKPVKRCHFIREVSVSTFVKTEAENLLVCLRPTYTSFLYDLFISVLCSSLLTRKMQIYTMSYYLLYTHQNGQN